MMDKKVFDRMPVTPRGFRLLLAGLLVMLAGYLLMTGGGSTDPQVFNEAMFDFRRLVAAPVVIVAGIVVEIVALMSCRDGKQENE
ncbi:MAG: DUF3098 domain-containing protein [Bacteroidales bacterium]|nr:DUF3098 domain-containing protein [Bacteroidales bacterium]